jgi:hypothetical protein
MGRGYGQSGAAGAEHHLIHLTPCLQRSFAWLADLLRPWWRLVGRLWG